MCDHLELYTSSLNSLNTQYFFNVSGSRNLRVREKSQRFAQRSASPRKGFGEGE